MLKVSDVITISLVTGHDVIQELHMLDVGPLLAGMLQDGATSSAPRFGNVILHKVNAVRTLFALNLHGPLQIELKLVHLHSQGVYEAIQILKSWLFTIYFLLNSIMIIIAIFVIVILVNLNFIKWLLLSFYRKPVIADNVLRILCWINLHFRLDLFNQWRLNDTKYHNLHI